MTMTARKYINPNRVCARIGDGDLMMITGFRVEHDNIVIFRNDHERGCVEETYPVDEVELME